MKTKRLSILFLTLLLCALISLPGCGIDVSSLGASASLPEGSVEEMPDETVDEVAVDGEQDETFDSEDEDGEDIDILEDETQSEEAATIDEEMVWIPKTGKCYHSKSTCSNMKDPKQVPLSEALRKNKTACSKCY